MSILIDGVAIPTDEEIRNAPAPWFDHDRAKFHQAIREAIAEREHQARQAEYIQQYEEKKYCRQRTHAPVVVIHKGIEYPIW